jgi:3-dehydrosphinganine reductase
VLDGAHAIVTGGSSGIGLATARHLAAAGCTVSLIARDLSKLDAAAEDLRASGATAQVAAADVSDQAAVVAAINALMASAGPCDVLVTSAGQARPGHFLELDDDIFRRMVEVDYFGTLWPIRAVAPGMVDRGRGSIMAISSAAGLVGIFGYSAYGPAKFAVRGLTESLRDELAPHGVRVGCVYPPDVDTPQLEDENRFKPAETAAISGTIKPLTADRVGRRVVDAIVRGEANVYPDLQTSLVAKLVPIGRPLFNRLVDQKVRKARR